MLELLYECRTSCMDRLSKYDASLEEAENLKPRAKITMCNIWYLTSKNFANEKMEGKSYRKEWLTLQVYWIPTCWNHSPRGNYCSVINTQSVHMSKSCFLVFLLSLIFDVIVFLSSVFTCQYLKRASTTAVWLWQNARYWCIVTVWRSFDSRESNVVTFDHFLLTKVCE